MSAHSPFSEGRRDAGYLQRPFPEAMVIQKILGLGISGPRAETQAFDRGCREEPPWEAAIVPMLHNPLNEWHDISVSNQRNGLLKSLDAMIFILTYHLAAYLLVTSRAVDHHRR